MILPQIANLAHAREATALAKYPPRGSRGVGYSRAMGYGGTGPGFFEAENRRTLCYAMIETPRALADVDAIARLDTVDGLFVGPADLSMTRGRGPFKATAKDLADFARVASVAAACRKSWAIPAPGAKVFAFARRHGATLVTVCDDLSALRLGSTQGLPWPRRAGRWRSAGAPEKFLAGRVAWVTGGATGIGRATAVALAQAGADIAIGSLPDSSVHRHCGLFPRPGAAEMEAAKAEIEATGARCFLSAFDLRSDQSVDDFHRGVVGAVGPVGILVNAAEFAPRS